MPPAATTGIDTLSAICGMRDINSIAGCLSSLTVKNEPLCPPASLPCATTISIPARSFSITSSTDVAVPTSIIFTSFILLIMCGLGIPNVKQHTDIL
ncbi:hypothetical protein HNO90_001130 [Staphylococcus hominis]|nr:hypothetical protein [Staphylococcus hominis]